MKSEAQIRKKLNRSIADYFNGKLYGHDKRLAEERIRELVWVLDECILVNNGEAKLLDKKRKKKK